MRLYLAASLSTVTAAKALAERLRLDGHEVASTWHDVVLEGERDPLDVDERRDVAIGCLCEVTRADAVVALLTDEDCRPRGTFIEIGYALGLAIPIVWVGGQHTVFDALPFVVHCDANMDHLPAALAAAWRLRGGK